MSKIIIVGAGISGLALAYRLNQLLPSADLTVLERSSRPGGTMWTERRDGYQVEVGPNGFLDSKPSTMDLCRELGLGEHLMAAGEAARNRYLFLNDKLVALPSSLVGFLRTSLLSWRGKLSVLAERFRRQGGGEEESVHDFVCRRFGREAAELLADALVTGIHAGDPHLLSMQAAFPRIAGFEREKGSVFKGMAKRKPRGRMTTWSLRGGLRTLVESLADQLGEKIRYQSSVARVERRAEAGWSVILENGQGLPADLVILTCPAYRQAEILRGLDAVLADDIAGIRYSGVAIVALGYRQVQVPSSVDGFGYIAPQKMRRDILGVQWCSSIFPGRAPEGHVLLRALAGGWNRPDILDWDDEQLLEAVRKELRLALSITAPPAFQFVARWRRAIPQYHLGHLERVARIRTRAKGYPGLFLAGNAYDGVAVNDCTEQAISLARQVHEFLPSPP
jgi:oxygen-dependent protoporphyrinogen oxidase